MYPGEEVTLDIGHFRWLLQKPMISSWENVKEPLHGCSDQNKNLYWRRKKDIVETVANI